ncbi:SDR family NAD(P)-dependent oxidoreductase [Aquibium carbonis]|uniref:SDR family NAD(P)-dependent oxidoreductase n=1 Tax=Aquibium carbonis TaxID=2495581 RepID=A0A3R9YTI0_9HYPH|nr:SDR family NAD(P)-dependent oxidoreductase [Aquibium carbonis]RST86719.1 SDR family NAD(P)-dependent oxidoreductase [Aquibium carbonis]
MTTVLITGCSTGFGRETAAHFLERGWSVVATMRDPSASTLPASDRLRVLPLDVTDADSIAAATAAAGAIDVLVNNAGVGWLNAVEGTPMATMRRVFETNLFATVAMMQAVLPGMRARRSGAIVNIGSSTTLKPMPLLSIYRASKAAVNALTESAALELAEFGIRARVVLPGAAPTTRFGDTARAEIAANGGFPDAYAGFVRQTMEGMQHHAASGAVTTAQDVAQAVFRAATDPDCPMVLPAGADAIAWSQGR